MLKAKLTDAYIKSLPAKEKDYEVQDSDLSGFRLIVWPTGKKSFCLRYRTGGKSRKFTIGKYGQLTATQARKIAQQKLGEVMAGKDIQAEKIEARKQAEKAKTETLLGFIEHSYKDWVEAHHNGSKETLRVLSKDFNHLHSKKLNEITPRDVHQWEVDAKKRGLATTTINRRVAILKSCLSSAKEWGVIKTSPIAGMKRLKSDQNAKVRFLSDDETSTLRSALETRQEAHRDTRSNHNEWLKQRHKPLRADQADSAFTDYLKPMVLLALNTGMRRGELFKLQWKDIDLLGRLLTVSGDKAKSKQTRHIPLTNEAESILLAWKSQQSETAPESLVFPNPETGQAFDNISKSWRKILDSAGIENFRFHDLRHSFASNLVMKGVDLYTVKELLGHSSIEMTQKYAHLSPDHKAAAIALLN